MNEENKDITKFEKQQKKVKINLKLIGAILLIFIIITTLSMFIGGKTYKIYVNNSGEVVKEGTPPPTIKAITEHLTTMPQVDIGYLYSWGNSYINGTNPYAIGAFEKYKDTDILGAVQILAKIIGWFANIIITIFILPFILVWNILVVVIWIFAMPFVL